MQLQEKQEELEAFKEKHKVKSDSDLYLKQLELENIAAQIQMTAGVLSQLKEELSRKNDPS